MIRKEARKTAAYASLSPRSRLGWRMEGLPLLYSNPENGLVVQDYAKKATMDRQLAAAFVIEKAMLFELIHEMADPRPGGANHLRQAFLIDSGKHCFGPAFLAKMRQQQQNPSQALLAGVEKLVDEIRFVSDDAGKQMSDKDFRESLLFVEHSCHDRLLNPGKSAIFH